MKRERAFFDNEWMMFQEQFQSTFRKIQEIPIRNTLKADTSMTTLKQSTDIYCVKGFSFFDNISNSMEGRRQEENPGERTPIGHGDATGEKGVQRVVSTDCKKARKQDE